MSFLGSFIPVCYPGAVIFCCPFFGEQCHEKAKQAAAQRGSDELNTILERLEKEDFTLTEYDDVVVRQLIEKITVESKDIITIRFKGGFEIRKELDIGN